MIARVAALGQRGRVGCACRGERLRARPAPSQSRHLFESFHTTKASGVGMRLSICRSMIQNHGGRLWATPNEPHGALFWIMLPNRVNVAEKLELSDGMK
jgi:hypothetical protein